VVVRQTLVVSSTARDGHDRDFNVFVLEDCCSAGSQEDHDSALTTIKKFATVGKHIDILNYEVNSQRIYKHICIYCQRHKPTQKNAKELVSQRTTTQQT
jgi:hypothetical protein